MESITYIDRATKKPITEQVPSEGLLKWLYGKPLGRLTLHALLKRKSVSKAAGLYMNSAKSKKRIQPFIDRHKLDMSIYTVNKASEFKHFNDFFYRKIKPEARPIGNKIVSPADGKVLAFDSLKSVKSFFVKGSEFTAKSFLNNLDIADKYEDGALFIVRLAPTDYHRFHFPAAGLASETHLIKGPLYSVSPLALKQSLRIFCQNKRTYCTLSTDNFGDILISDVGATMVGSIFQTYTPNSKVEAGDEKGYFAFGGSTLVMLFEKGKIAFSEDLLENTRNGVETAVKMGETIAIEA